MKRQFFIGVGVLVIIAAVCLIVVAKAHKVWTVSNEIRIAKPTPVVFDYVTTAANWPKWHPASMAVKSIQGDVNNPGNIGDRIWESICVADRKVEIIWTVTKKDVPRLWQIRGEVGDGLVIGTITYKLRASGHDATVYTRTFISEVNSRRLNLMYSLFIYRRIKEGSTRAVNQLKEKLELIDAYSPG